MPTATRTFRVFVSSTFEDLEAERNALQRDVFPKLRKLCEENGARFQAIDLRWGVRDEAALDQQTMEICLREIERCQQTGIKPNFVVLLGARYGWRPLPARIEAQEFEGAHDQVADPDQQLLDDWYQRDDNAIPPENLLKPRTGEFVDDVRWRKIEHELQRILRESARAAGLAEAKLAKYFISATHKEILKGLGETDEDRKHVFAFFREAAQGVEEDPDLTALKKYLRKKLPEGNIRSFSASDFAKLCADVEKALSEVILAEAGRFTSRPALDLEIEAHEAFAHDRARYFTGRKSVLDAIDAHIRGGEIRPLVVHGASGCGKSAIVAKASAQVKAEMPSAVVIQGFIGVTPNSSNGLTLLHSLCEQLSREYGVTDDTPMGLQELVVVFHDRMARATAERPLVLFLDALDQLRSDDEARSFTWLHQTLPPHVSLVVSTTEIPAGLHSAPQVAVGDFPVADAAEVLAAWLEDAKPKRKLRPEQRQKVLSGFAQSKLPLYLKLAFEEARRWRSFDTAETGVIGDDVGSMVDVLFRRLSDEANHGPIMVNRSLALLAAARYGLTEDEMLDVLAADDEVWKDFESRSHHTPPERRLPVIVWSRLFLDLEPYLNERAAPGGNVMAFYHRQVAESAAWLYLQKEESTLRHAALAKYFGEQSHWRNRAPMLANERKVTELVRHEIGANALANLEKTLTDLDYIAAKCAAGLVVDLELDYRDAIAALPEAQAEVEEEARRQSEAARWTEEIIDYARQWSERRGRMAERGLLVRTISELLTAPRLPEIIHSAPPWSEGRIEQEAERIRKNPTRLDRLRAFQGFVQQETYPLLEFGTWPGFAVQHALNYAPRGPVHAAAANDLLGVRVLTLTRRWSVQDHHNPRPALLRSLLGHKGGVWGVSVTADGRRAISASDDKTLRLWDVETGACLWVLEGHAGLVRSVSVTPDGRRAISGGGSELAQKDYTVRLWDLETGLCLRELGGHRSDVMCVALTPDGRRAVSASDDHTVRVWDLDVGTCLRVIEGHSGKVKSVSMTPDGQRAISASDDKTLRLWDVETGACLAVLEGHTAWIDDVSVTPDGRRAVSAGLDTTIRVWDLETGACLQILEGHTMMVRSVSLTPDGRCAVSGSMDTTVRVWDLDTGACVSVLKGHGPWDVKSVSVSADGRQAVSAGYDRTVQVWDLTRGEDQRAQDGHTHVVQNVSISGDSRRAVSASRDKTLRVWDLETGECMHVLQGHAKDVTSVSLTTDGRRAVSASVDKTLRVWDLETGACLWVLEGHTVGVVYSVIVTADGRRAVSAGGDKTLRLWDVRSGVCLRVLEGHTGEVLNVSLTPDGHRAVSASGDKTLRVWDLETGRCLHMLEGHTHWVMSVRVTVDGRRAVSASRDKTLRVWDLETGECLHVFHGHTKDVTSVSLTTDGQRAVSASDDKTLRVWNVKTGVCLWVLEGHTDLLRSVSVTLDGRYAISAGGDQVSMDQTLRVWDLATGACATMVSLKAAGTTVAISPLLSRIVVGTSVGKVLQFDLRGMTLTATSHLT
jgi:WD40 repeat protein